MGAGGFEPPFKWVRLSMRPADNEARFRVSFFEVWGILWAFSLPFVPYVRRAVRRRRYQRCLARIERLEIELGYRKRPRFPQSRHPLDIVELRPGAAMPTYIVPQGTMLPSNVARLIREQQLASGRSTFAELLYEIQSAGRSQEEPTS